MIVGADMSQGRIQQSKARWENGQISKGRTEQFSMQSKVGEETNTQVKDGQSNAR